MDHDPPEYSPPSERASASTSTSSLAVGPSPRSSLVRNGESSQPAASSWATASELTSPAPSPKPTGSLLNDAMFSASTSAQPPPVLPPRTQPKQPHPQPHPPKQQKTRTFSKSKSKAVNDFDSLVDGLTSLYTKKIKPLEAAYQFDVFHSAPLSPADIAAKPMVLLIGQYSVGKSTFVKYVLERNYPGIQIGPEPTTDRFFAILHSGQDGVIPGNAAAVDSNLPFTGLQRFGTAFLTRFAVAQCDAPLLEHLSLIDTPGVLAGAKQSIGRGYDFTKVVEWFAERSDLILLLFDSNKLDISDEFRASIDTLKPHVDKVRVVLNKADSISGQQLMRVYGALMWSLGKSLGTPEVVRVYMGSFHDEPLKGDMKDVLSKEMEDLLDDMRMLPRNAAMRKINDIVRRARIAKVHGLIISHLAEAMPNFFGKDKKQDKLVNNLSAEFEKIALANRLAPGDFPDVAKYQEILKFLKLSELKKYSEKYFTAVDDVLGKDIPALMNKFPSTNPKIEEAVKNPFQLGGLAGSGFNGGGSEGIWSWDLIPREKYRPQFHALQPVDSRLSGQALKPLLESSNLPPETLRIIWRLSDWSNDGYLDWDEFCVAMYLIDQAVLGFELPETLPWELRPKKGRV